MVTINGTIFVELVLFLIFLWGANRFAFRPAFKVMDERTAALERDQRVAEEGTRDAEASEGEYQEAMTGARRAANEGIRDVRKEGKSAYLKALAERKAQSDEAVARVRAIAMEEVERQRTHYNELAPELVQATQERLGLGGSSR